MRTTIVPAQITTVEDRIAGNLGLTQVMLLITPVFIGSALYVVLPPFFSYAIYKVGLIVLLALSCGMLAIRVRGKIALLWLIVLLKYNLRPAYYVFNKNSSYLRQTDVSPQVQNVADLRLDVPEKRIAIPGLAPADLMKVEEFVADPSANVHFTTNKKGELRVLLTEVPRESLSTPAN